MAKKIGIGCLTVIGLLVLLIVIVGALAGSPKNPSVSSPPATAPAASTPAVEIKKIEEALAVNDIDTAFRLATEAAKTFPDSSEVKTALEKASKARLDYSAKAFAEGTKSLAAKDYVSASTAFQKVIEADPNYQKAQQGLKQATLAQAKKLFADKQYQIAQSWAREAVRLMPESQEAKSLLTKIEAAVAAEEAAKPKTYSGQHITLKNITAKYSYGYVTITGVAVCDGDTAVFSPTIEVKVYDSSGATLLAEDSTWPTGTFLKEMAPGTSAAFQAMAHVVGEPGQIRWQIRVKDYPFAAE